MKTSITCQNGCWWYFTKKDLLWKLLCFYFVFVYWVVTFWIFETQTVIHTSILTYLLTMSFIYMQYFRRVKNITKLTHQNWIQHSTHERFDSICKFCLVSKCPLDYEQLLHMSKKLKGKCKDFGELVNQKCIFLKNEDWFHISLVCYFLVRWWQGRSNYLVTYSDRQK